MRRGDVLAMLDPDTWIGGNKRTEYYRLMWAAIAALVVCARVTLHRAARLTLAEFDENRPRFPTSHGRSYPIVLLPVAVEAMERYLVHRRKLGGTALFVGPKGEIVTTSAMTNAFDRLGARYGMDGGELFKRLFAFFDRCLVGEKDVAAVVALRHGTSGRTRRRARRSEVEAAAGDEARLRKILKRRHPLKGEPGRWLGGHGKAKIKKETRLFRPVKGTIVISEFMRTDPVCARLLKKEWKKPGMVGQRREVKRDDLPYLSSLLDRKLLSPRQLGHLLNCHPVYAVKLARDVRLAAETPQACERRRREERRWAADAVRLFRERTDRSEKPRAFHARLAKAGYPFEWFTMMNTLTAAGLMPAQIAKKMHKAKPSEKTSKVEKSGFTVEENERNGPPRERSDELPMPGNGI